MRIVADYREQASGLIDLLREEMISLEVRKLDCGDYIVNEAITIERKTARDFLISIIDRRLFVQLSKLKKFSPNPVLIIEGDPFHTDFDFDEAAIRGALISSQAIWYVPVIHSRSKEETKNIIVMIGRQEDVCTDVVPLRGGYRPRRLKSRQLFILQGLPKVGPATAKRLLKHFRSVSNVMNATVEDLLQVEGIGRISAAKIRQVLDTEVV